MTQTRRTDFAGRGDRRRRRCVCIRCSGSGLACRRRWCWLHRRRNRRNRLAHIPCATSWLSSTLYSAAQPAQRPTPLFRSLPSSPNLRGKIRLLAVALCGARCVRRGRCGTGGGLGCNWRLRPALGVPSDTKRRRRRYTALARTARGAAESRPASSVESKPTDKMKKIVIEASGAGPCRP